jgi:3-phenylpropionate/trans-cinnamate dioxygenase ferredoxin subunit
MAEFVTVATTDEVKPGDRLVFEIGRQWIVLLNVDGHYYAVEDNCTHEEHTLSDGALDGHALECSKHGAQFDVRDGKVLAPPAHVAVRTYPIRVEGDDIQIEWE